MITAAATRSSVAVVRRTLIKAVDQGQAVVQAGGEVQGRAYRRELSAQPVPGDLRRTVDTFLSYARPLVSADQLRHTAQLADQFLKWPGPELQTLFQKFAQEHTNWMSYLGQVGQLSDRGRLLDFAGSFCPAAKTVSSLDGQLWLASTIVSALLHFKWQLDNQTIETGRLGGQEQCMSSFQHAFCSCRVPAVPCDRFIVYPTSSPSTRHIIVMYNDQIFSVDVYAESGRALSTEQLYEQLKEVTQSSTSGSQPVGLLTYLPRESWAAIFKELVQDEKNSAVMVNIQRSLFVLTLDPPVPPTVSAPLPSTSTLTVTRHASDIPQLYYGGGSDFNPGNRWLDKSLQVIVGAGGAWGIQTEHIAVDGTHVAQMVDHVSDFVRTSSPEGNVGIPRQQVRPPTRLRLNLTTKAISAIGKARQLVQSPEVELEFSGFTVKGMGTEVVKNWGMSTDAFIQVALQLAYYRLHQRPSRAVEYVSKRCHHLGRLDLVHCTTPETLAFIHDMDSGDVSPRDKLRRLKKALHAHKSQVNEIRSGYSICSHFKALKDMALQYGFEFPPLFLDPSFTLAFQFDVSSSQVPYKHEMTSCYLPEEKDGYACPYTPYDHHINFHIISCRQHLRDSSSHLMSCSIVSALTDMGQLAQFEMTVDPV